MFKFTFIFCALVFLSFGCSEDVEQKRWDFNTYFEILKGNQFYEKYKESSLFKTRPNAKTLYNYEYRDSIVIVFDLEDDYSYKIKYSVDMETRDRVSDLPSHIEASFKQAISDCKSLQIFGFHGSQDRFNVMFYMSNLNRNSIPESLNQIEWISDSTMASFEFGPDLEIVSNDAIVRIPLNDKWYLTAYRTDIWNTEWP